MPRVNIQVSFDTDEPGAITHAVMSLLYAAVPFMADNVEIEEVE